MTADATSSDVKDRGMWLGVIGLIDGLGVALLGVAYTGARAMQSWPEVVYWISLLLFLVPTTLRLLSARTSRSERIGLIIATALCLYLVKVLRSPLLFTGYDELIHYRTTLDILQSGHLFGQNYVLPSSSLFPGLETVTAFVVTLTGLPIYDAGSLVVGAARVVQVTAIYLLYERLAGSEYVAGLGALLYIANPRFLFFDAAFAYESLALPLSILVLYALAYRTLVTNYQEWLGLTAISIVGVAAVVMTHHFTAYALSATLVVWAISPWVLHLLEKAGARFGTAPGRRTLAMTSKPAVAGLGAVATFAGVGALAWLIYVATLAVRYVSQFPTSGVREVMGLVLGGTAFREVFQSHTGRSTPVWEIGMVVASSGLILLGLPVGARQVWRFRRYLSLPLRILAVTLTALAAFYPVSLVLRFSTLTWALGTRSLVYIYLGLGYVLTMALAGIKIPFLTGWKWRLGALTALIIVLIGGFLVSTSPTQRLPGSYMVSNDMRSVGSESLTLVDWAREMLGRHRRFYADRTNGMLLASYGEQRLITCEADRFYPDFMFAPEVNDRVSAVLNSGIFEYLVVDGRLSSAPPEVGIYFDSCEPNVQKHRVALDPAALAKFATIGDLSRVYDSGNIVIYWTGVKGE